MSASTWPGPTEGSWSTSPTRISAARGGTALSSACIKGTSTIETSSTTSSSHSSGCSSPRLKPPWAGSASSSRCRVLASRPVASPSRLAARPVGAARAMAGVLAGEDLEDAVDQGGLAHARPAGDHQQLGAQRQAHRLPLALGQGDPGLAPRPRPSAWSASTSGQGGLPLASRSSRSAMPRSARCSPARNTQAGPRRCPPPPRPRRAPARAPRRPPRPGSPAARRRARAARPPAGRNGPRPWPRPGHRRCRPGRGSSPSSRSRAAPRSGRRS